MNRPQLHVNTHIFKTWPRRAGSWRFVLTDSGPGQEVGWRRRALSPSAGAGALSMRRETTTNSAPPPAAVTLSKQRPRPSLRMIHCINPIKPCLRNTVRWQTVRGRWNMSCTKGWMARKHTHTHTLGCSPCAQSSYSHPQAPSQCLRSPTPHLDRNIVMLNKRPAAGGQMLKPLQW